MENISKYAPLNDYCTIRCILTRKLVTLVYFISICEVEIKSKQEAPKSITYNATAIRFVINYSVQSLMAEKTVSYYVEIRKSFRKKYPTK